MQTSNQISKAIFLNARSKTKSAFEKLSNDFPYEIWQTRDMAMLLTTNTTQLLHKTEPVSFENTIIFNRFPIDLHFVGLLHEHATRTNATITNPIYQKFVDAPFKIAQMPRLAAANLPIPKTLILHTKTFDTYTTFISENFSFPLVAKTNGLRGEQVKKIESLENLNAYVETISTHDELFLIQEIIENDGDVRILCAFGEYLGAIKRTGKPGSFYNNVALGASVEKYECSEEEIATALQAAAVNETDFTGIDIIPTEKGPVLLEINPGPGIVGFESIYGDGYVFTKIAEHIATQMKP